MIKSNPPVAKAKDDPQTVGVLQLVTGLVSAYVSNNHLAASEIPSLISTVYNSLTHVGNGSASWPAPEPIPAATIKRSVTDEYIICLEDGKKLRTLKRYLRSHFDMSPEEYRAKWRLPHDYPMTAPAYARIRSHFAKKFGLGTKPLVARVNRRKSG